MKTIKIFLASPEELKEKRNTMADFVLHLNKLLKGRGLELELEKGESLDAPMSGKHKQDKYNDVLKQCDICSFEDHFLCMSQNVDAMKLEILLQLENCQKDLIGEKTIEVRNEHVYVDNEALVDLNNIPFVAQNEGFKKMQSELNCLNSDIEKLKQKLITREEFDCEQQNLFNTTRRIIVQRGMKNSQRMSRAIEAFENGDAQRADIILDEAQKDFEEARDDFRVSKKVCVQALEEQITRASFKMSNTSIPIKERVIKTLDIYKESDDFALEINYDRERYISFLFDYCSFLETYALYNKATAVYYRLIKMCEDLYGTEHPDTATSYYKIGNVYKNLRNYPRALEYYQKALKIREKVLGVEHPDTANSYNKIGIVYGLQGDYPRALEYLQKSLEIIENVLGSEHPDTAGSYGNIGNVYSGLGDYPRALEYYQKALKIQEKVLVPEHPDTATSYYNIGNVYSDLGDNSHALEYYQKALKIQEKVLGAEHPDTVRSYNNIGYVYNDQGDYPHALEYYHKALKTNEKMLGPEHPNTARSYNNLAWTYHLMGKYKEALPWAEKTVAVFPDDPDKIDTLAIVYQGLGRYDEALEQFERCLDLYMAYGFENGIRETNDKIATLTKLMQSESANKN